MANWRDTILKDFKPMISRLTLVADPRTGCSLRKGCSRLSEIVDST